ncbi:MAG TPA: type VI secretion system tube protein TssD [Gaiellaceae bacterium]|jgi:type VI secretion system secreted protein Hcp|nr:type VI secretion system tube protein TssD [Gaiellaceae bacterium]
MRRKLVFGVGFVALVVAGFATYAWAASSAGQTINACVNNDGNLRLVPAVSNCRRAETPLSWNTVGPAGPQGLPGVQGPTGAAGPAGRDGRDATSSNPPDPDSVAGTVMITGAKQGAFSTTPIALTGLSHEIISPRDPASGLATGKRQHKPIVFTKQLDSTTPLLLNALVTNETLTSVLIGLLRNGQQVATIKLTNASVADYTDHGDTEHWSLTYQKIEWTWVDGGITASDDWEAPVA